MPLHRNSQAPRRVVDPLFAIPEGLGDLDYDDDPRENDLWYDLNEDDSDPETPGKKKKKKKKKKHKKKDKGKKKGKKKKKKHKNNKDKDGRGKSSIGTPKHLEIVKQTMRTKQDGSQVVDIVVEVDKIKAADKYEFRLTKQDTGKTTVV